MVQPTGNTSLFTFKLGITAIIIAAIVLVYVAAVHIAFVIRPLLNFLQATGQIEAKQLTRSNLGIDEA